MRQTKIVRPLLSVLGGTLLVLLVPAVAMQFTREVNWSVSDFMAMGMLLFSSGAAFVLLTRTNTTWLYRSAAALGLLAALLLVWANLAVGLIGSGPNVANLMYIAVLAIGFVFVLRSGLRAAGMERAMLATAVALAVHALISLMTGMHRLPGSSVFEIVAVDSSFALLFIWSGLLSKIAANRQSSSGEGASV